MTKVVRIKTFADIANELFRLGYKQDSKKFKELYGEMRQVFVSSYLYVTTGEVKEKQVIKFPRQVPVVKGKVFNNGAIKLIEISFDVDHTSWVA